MKSKGIIQQIKEQGGKSIYSDLKIEDIREAFSDLVYSRVDTKNPIRMPSVKKVYWEDKGEIYYCWKIDTGRMVAHTNDAGMESFEKELRKQAGL